MADSNSTFKQEPATELHRKPLFEEFYWHQAAVNHARLDGERVMDFVSDAKDLAAGVETIMQLIEHDFMAEDFETRPLMSDFHRGTLRRLGMVALKQLNAKCDSFMTWAYEYHTQEGVTERKQRRGG